MKIALLLSIVLNAVAVYSTWDQASKIARYEKYGRALGKYVIEQDKNLNDCRLGSLMSL